MGLRRVLPVKARPDDGCRAVQAHRVLLSEGALWSLFP